MRIKFILGALLVLTVLVFSTQNAGMVEVKFFVWSFPVSLAVVIFAALAVGFMGGWIITSAFRLMKRNRKSEPPQAM